MPLHDAHYQHWKGEHTSIWARRRVIAQNGLSACLQTKLLRHVTVLCWMTALLMAGFLFFLGQLLVPDSMVERWVAQMNSELRTFFHMLTTWLQVRPDLSAETMQNVLFYFYCVYLMPFSIFALGMALPALVTRDLASSAIVIYSSKAVTRLDYLLGKFCTAFGVMALTWLGPVCAAWFMGNLLAPDWKFFWYARVPMLHALIFGLSSMVILSLLALGVSAFSSREKATPALWFTWWVLGLAIQPIALHTLPWLRHVSFGYNLRQIALATFQLGRDLKTAQDGIPIFGDMLKQVRPETRAALDNPTLAGALAGLALMLLAAGLVLRKRVAPE
jgi:ABC-2 type transport system permease protein